LFLGKLNSGHRWILSFVLDLVRLIRILEEASKSIFVHFILSWGLIKRDEFANKWWNCRECGHCDCVPGLCGLGLGANSGY
jgi:hypothetical protein